ncbi:hypothetical protein [Streptomyces sp. IB2014 016-6]|uniref:hypothetical protein n=1 Tax=Streptomyces sp. IB2014 016-6 TaxID=2517818 RepID=UPI0011C768F9|nr:hypothetical protein [Streptomyces sp. IB2014 016-6]TXL87918.1 hypothetical protein EW053_21185 [Streptomyces sp. IB2014 016-6]
MRRIGTASAAIVGAAALVLGAGWPAFAGDGAEFEYSVSPETIEPGGEVELRTKGCRVPAVTVSSGVFETVTLNEGEAKSVRIFDDVKPEAEYEITFDCDGKIRSLPLMIKTGEPGEHRKPGEHSKPGKPEKPAESGKPPGPWEPPRPKHPERPEHSERPVHPDQRPHEPRPHEDTAHKGVKAGIGGSTDGGPNTAGLAVGAAVIAVALGGAGRLLRRRPVNGS